MPALAASEGVLSVSGLVFRLYASRCITFCELLSIVFASGKFMRSDLIFLKPCLIADFFASGIREGEHKDFSRALKKRVLMCLSGYIHTPSHSSDFVLQASYRERKGKCWQQCHFTPPREKNQIWFALHSLGSCRKSWPFDKRSWQIFVFANPVFVTFTPYIFRFKLKATQYTSKQCNECKGS